MKWISVKDRLPMFDEVVLIYGEPERYVISYLQDEHEHLRRGTRPGSKNNIKYAPVKLRWVDDYCDQFEYEDITHWMPLPDKPT